MTSLNETPTIETFYNQDEIFWSLKLPTRPTLYWHIQFILSLVDIEIINIRENVIYAQMTVNIALKNVQR